MSHVLSLRSKLALFSLVLLLGSTPPALAGPPLLCFPFDIGTAQSLPWKAGGWKGMESDYDSRQLASDTVKLLTPSTSVLVRMETLRRATLYGTRDAEAARALMAALMTRARANGADALALFDAGYLVESYRQAAPISSDVGAIVAGMDGYSMVRESLSRRHDPAIEFAAALMTGEAARADHDEHVRRARAGAASNQLLARNINQLSR